jgi:hypothetical protein
LGLLTIALGLPVALAAQESLGDLARQIRAQREKAAKKPAKVYTNENLPARPPGEGLTAATSMSSEAAAKPSTGEAASTEAASTAAEETKQPSSEAGEETKSATGTESSEDKIKSKEYWQARFKIARLGLSRAKDEQQLAEDELNLLQIQEVRELDPNARNELQEKVKAKQAEVGAKRAATAKAQKALDDLEKEFKESGAPEDWSKTE